MQQNQPLPITLGDGALVGLLAGVVGTVVWAILYVPIQAVTGVLAAAVRRARARVAGDLPPNSREMLETRQGAGPAVLRSRARIRSSCWSSARRSPRSAGCSAR